jgi:uncharacterized protein
VPQPRLFLDTAYINALYNTRDQWHSKAVEWRAKVVAGNYSFITTQFILAEIADAFSALRFRNAAVEIVHGLMENPLVKVVPASDELFHAGLELYESRPDKNWGLTDCFSFVTMRDKELTDALTTDDHFRQAGFNALLLD